MLRIFALALSVPALAVALPPEQAEFFEKRIRPVLAGECFECHGAEKQKAGLRLDFRGGWEKGGDSGAVIVPGEPAKSLLLKSIRHDDPDLAMPQKRPKLPATVIADFEKWIASGAPDPRDEPPKPGETTPWEQVAAQRAQWWSLRPVAALAPPKGDSSWAWNDADKFLHEKMAAAGLVPAADADPRVLVRRIYYLLTGLPPTAAEADAFAAAAASDRRGAIRDLTARLLADTRFGEHWARHWLDLVRYAETHGSESDPAIPEAWRYRDYVIRAMNSGVPWDAFIREHLAGDHAAPRPGPGGTNDALLGLAHLRLVEHGFQPIDTRDEQVKTVDSQIDVITKAFMGLTVSCARCHDHKFDAISQRDFTALAGIMESSRPAMLTLDLPAGIAAQKATLAPLKARLRDAIADAWKNEASQFAVKINGIATSESETRKMRETLATLAREQSEIESAARARVLAKRGKKDTGPVVAPISRWGFESDARDSAGALHGELLDGATIRGGRLVLSSRAYARTAPLARKLGAKTLEAWVSPATFDQGGGGVVTVEDKPGNVFDSIVFAEHRRQRWMAGSDNYRRGVDVAPFDETAKPGDFTHLAITYATDGHIAIYRNGEPHGAPWRKADLVTFDAESHVLLGLRHLPARGNGHFQGEIEEARLYDRALSAAEVAASFRAGVGFAVVTRDELLAAIEPAQREQLRKIEMEKAAIEKALNEMEPGGKNLWANVLAESKKPTPPPPRALRVEPLALKFRTGADIADVADGAFLVPHEGPRFLSPLLPRGVATGSLTKKHGGIAATPRFKIETDFISIRAAGSSAWCRLIVDGYPLGVNPIFPRAALNHEEPRWLKLDTKYRRGSWAYLEFATANDLSRREKVDDRSWFFADAVAFHDGDGPASPPTAVPIGHPAHFQDAALAAVAAWRSEKLTAAQFELLAFLTARELLPATTSRVPQLAPLLDEYRKAEAAVPVPHRAPGVMEGDGYDAAFLPRGDHHKPAAPVPRGFIAACGAGDFGIRGTASGRAQLAEALTSPRNPLAARVMVNRVWHHVFGRGIVATPDNFGKMGEAPSHPELLDFLAARFVAGGWNAKALIAELLNSRAFQLASEPGAARERDPANRLLSHGSVRRLPAESIRDTLLVHAGRLEPTRESPGAGDDAPRRSIYLGIRRNALNPFLTTFDAPKPFSTLGRRDATNVPAQALTLLNSPFVIECADAWAKKTAALAAPARIEAMFRTAFARPPSEKEAATAAGYIGTGGDPAWRDFAQSLFNLKEFTWLR